MRSCYIVPTLICGAVALSGCQSEKEYPVSVAESLHRLNQADKEGFRYHRHCGVLFKIDSHQSNNDPSVIWTARTSKKAVVSFTVSVSPSPNGVTTKITQILDQGFPAEYDDPPGPSLETVRKLAAKNNWPKN